MATELSILSGLSTCERTLRFIRCFRQFVSTEIPIRIFSDGSLDDKTSAMLESSAPSIKLMDVAEVGDRVDFELRSRPYCRKYRDYNIVGKKLFDLPINSSGYLHYMDTDVFFRRPSDLGEFWSLGAADFAFLRDCQQSYCLGLREMANLFVRYCWRNLRPICFANTGCIGMRMSCYDLDFLEWLLSKVRYHSYFLMNPWWHEQTTYAYLAGRYRAAYLDPKMIRVPIEEEFVEGGRAGGCVALHFVATIRHRLDDWMRITDDRCEPAKIRLVEAERISMLTMASS